MGIKYKYNIVALSVLIVLLFSFTCVSASNDVQPHNWVVCPSCKSPVVEETSWELTPDHEVNCINGAMSNGKILHDLVYKAYTVYTTKCVNSACGFEGVSGKVYYSDYTFCPHKVRNISEFENVEEELKEEIMQGFLQQKKQYDEYQWAIDKEVNKQIMKEKGKT